MSKFAGTDIYLVRHGLSRANVTPSLHRDMADSAIELMPEGHVQAYRAGVFLREHLRESEKARASSTAPICARSKRPPRSAGPWKAERRRSPFPIANFAKTA